MYRRANAAPSDLRDARALAPQSGGTGRATEATREPASPVIDAAVAGLDAWLETMRGPGGYGGPVAHWWQQSLVYTGPGLDWRYEGIIAGYLNLWRRTGDERWLAKACRAGDDLVSQQSDDGHFPASAFELNPATAGTPHEAACDAALLLLAQALRAASRPGWERHAACAERNLRAFYLEQMWDAEASLLRDSPRGASFVPNKAATVCEALFLLAELTGEAAWVERYALPTLAAIAAYQVRENGTLDGAIAQGSLDGRLVEKYFPYYIARCVPALVRGYEWTNDERHLDAALRAARFIARWTYPDGSLPAVVYPGGRVNRYPSWVAPLGDVLRALDELRPHGLDAKREAMLYWLLSGRDESGGIATAVGFAAQAGGEPPALPDLRDRLHVAGWTDKAFRYLSGLAGPSLAPGESKPFETACTYRGSTVRLVETPAALTVLRSGEVRYLWHKGERWPRVAAPEYWLR